MLLAVVATPEHLGAGNLLSDLFWILGSVAAVALITRKINLALIPAYLLTGTLIGPTGLGAVQSSENLNSISHLAIILLMFGIGLELHLSALAHGLARMAATGGVTVALTVLVLWPLLLSAGFTAPTALAVAMALSLSSTAVVMRLLADRREMRLMSSRLSLATLIIQDLAVIGMLAILPLLAQWSAGQGPAMPDAEPVNWLEGTVQAAIRLGGAVGLIFAGRYFLPALVRAAAKNMPAEIMTILAVGTALGAALLTQLLGFSLELGAFLSGLALSATPFRHHIGGQIAPLRDLFVAVFFTTLGMKVDLLALQDSWWIVLLAAGALLLLKSTVTTGVAWSLGATMPVALSAGLNLAQAGEFSMVLLDATTRNDLLTDAQLANLIAVIVVTLVLAPTGMSLGRRWSAHIHAWGTAPWLNIKPLSEAAPSEAGPPETTGKRRAIVAGFGPFGRTIAERLDALGVEYAVIEMNPDTVMAERKKGRNIVYGDAANSEVLLSAGLDSAETLILTIPDEDAVERANAAAKRLRPDVYVVVRASTLRRGQWAEALGADAVIVEEKAGADAMAKLITGLLAGERHPPK